MAEPRDLRATQELLGNLLRRFDAIDHHPDGSVRDALAAVVSGNDRLTPLEQAEIYREQFWLRHRDSLYEDFPGLLRFLGHEAFDELAKSYLLAHPPSSWTLRDLPLKLAAHVADYDGFDPEQRDAARDLCRYELAFVPIFDAADVAPLDPAKLQAIAPEAWSRARIVLHPALTLFTLDYPVHRYRAAVRNEEEPPRLDCAVTHLGLWRAGDLRVRHAELGADEIELLRALQGGELLGSACERAAERTGIEAERFAAQLQAWFASWAERGWVVDVVV
jgi:hypothetical protein